MAEDGTLLGDGQIGELVVRSGIVMKGYYKNPQATDGVSRFGWHHTGDTGFRDRSGFFRLVDRARDVIISGGLNVFPSEIEQVLWSHPAVQGGIGLAIGLRAARDGANVVIAAKTASPHPKLDGTIYTAAAAIERAGGNALPLALDVRDADGIDAAVTAAVAHFGGIDICVNNASAISLSGSLETSPKQFDLLQMINTRGTYLVSRACVTHLRRSPLATC